MGNQRLCLVASVVLFNRRVRGVQLPANGGIQMDLLIYSLSSALQSTVIKQL